MVWLSVLQLLQLLLLLELTILVMEHGFGIVGVA